MVMPSFSLLPLVFLFVSKVLQNYFSLYLSFSFPFRFFQNFSLIIGHVSHCFVTMSGKVCEISLQHFHTLALIRLAAQRGLFQFTPPRRGDSVCRACLRSAFCFNPRPREGGDIINARRRSLLSGFKTRRFLHFVFGSL